MLSGFWLLNGIYSWDCEQDKNFSVILLFLQNSAFFT